jgi:ATP-binding cassette subfamily F protein 3
VTQQIKDVAGSLLFSGEMVEKKIRVLSGGERARLVMAGLLLQRNNVLVLDEPGNHLDVESVEALAEALISYSGTVIFTSHDRHFMHRVATHVVEVRAGKVASYPGGFDEYVYRVQAEIDSGLRAPH